jgi:hypothetical protein
MYLTEIQGCLCRNAQSYPNPIPRTVGLLCCGQKKNRCSWVVSPAASPCLQCTGHRAAGVRAGTGAVVRSVRPQAEDRSPDAVRGRWRWPPASGLAASPARGSRPRARPPAVSRGHCLGVAEGPPPLGRARAPAAGPLRALAAGLVAGRQTGRGRGGSVQSLQPWALQAAWRGQGPYGRASRPLVPGRRARARDRAGPLAAERQAGRKNAQPGVAEARMNCAVMCAPP